MKEVQEIAQALLQAVLEKYPNSFSDKTYEATESYLDLTAKAYYYHNSESKNFCLLQDGIDKQELQSFLPFINARPNGKTELPTFLDNLGTMSFEYQLDF